MKSTKFSLIIFLIIFLSLLLVVKFLVPNKPSFKEKVFPTPSPTPFLPITKTKSQISSDQKLSLLMETTVNEDQSLSYKFYAINNEDKSSQLVFSQTLTSAVMELPFNTFSPNNKYFFITKKTLNDKVQRVLVFQTSGEYFADDQPYLELLENFQQLETDNIFQEATGWAADNLIIFNTTTAAGEPNYSYWFEVPSGQIILLSTKF